MGKTSDKLVINDDPFYNEKEAKEDNHEVKEPDPEEGVGSDKEKSGGNRGFFHVNRELIPLKVTLFLFYGAMSATLPYLTIHMKDIGISLSQIGIIYAALPFTAFLGPPIMGYMGDKMGQYKSVLIVSTIISGVFYTLLLVVPKYSESHIYAPAVIEFRSEKEGGTILRPESPDLCEGFMAALRHVDMKTFSNQIVTVHSCSSNSTNNGSGYGDSLSVASPIASRGISGNLSSWTVWIPPEKCHFKEAPNEDKDIPELSCETSNKPSETAKKENNKSLPSFPGRVRRSTSNKCHLKVRINPIHPEQKTSLEHFVCSTNFTFPSGKKITDGNEALTFWLYFFFRTVANIFSSACYSLLDATSLAMVKNHPGAEYGRERIFSTMGYAIISPLAGLLVDVMSETQGFTDYSSAFYLADVLIVFNIVVYFFIELEVEKPSDDFWINGTALLKYPEMIVFLGMIFILGNMWGFVESYLFIFLDELHAPKYLLGLTMTVGSVSSIPFLFCAENLVAKAGRVNIIALAFFFYCIRFVGYSYIPNPFWCFPFEAMEAITYHLMWVAAATYCAVLSPKGLLATLTGVMGSLHYGLGKGSGAFIGGHVINMFTTRLSFRYFGIFSGIFGLVYFLTNKVWLAGAILKRKERERREAEENGASEQKAAMMPSANAIAQRLETMQKI